MDVTFKQIVIECSEFVIHIYFEVNSDNRSEDIVELLNEARYKGKPIGGTYYAIEHKPKVPPNAPPHYHFYDRNNHLFAINKDGSAHDASHGYKINNTIANFLKNVGYILPPDNIIESINPPDHMREVCFNLQFADYPDNIEIANIIYIEPAVVLNG